MSIADNLKQVLAELPQGVRLVAVSKFHPNEAIEEAYQAGQRIFGESKVQEMTAKYESLPKDIEWHFIGHLQTNKIKYMIPYVAMIHGIDSYKLLAEVNKQAVKAGRTVNCLLQIHVAQEETKFGFSPEECKEGLFPEYGGGVYTLDNKATLIVSRGLGDSGKWPRINNVPELWCRKHL